LSKLGGLPIVFAKKPAESRAATDSSFLYGNEVFVEHGIVPAHAPMWSLRMVETLSTLPPKIVPTA